MNGPTTAEVEQVGAHVGHRQVVSRRSGVVPDRLLARTGLDVWGTHLRRLTHMAPDANPPISAEDEERLAAIAAELADRVEATVPGWIERLVLERVRDWNGHVSAEVAAEAVAAAEAAHRDVVPRMRALLGADIDEQTANPLEVLRGATRHAHAALTRIGVPSVARDDFAQRSFPGDSFDLMPATWSDVDPSLHEIGLTWGAAKAYVHKARRRAEGRS